MYTSISRSCKSRKLYQFSSILPYPVSSSTIYTNYRILHATVLFFSYIQLISTVPTIPNYLVYRTHPFLPYPHATVVYTHPCRFEDVAVTSYIAPIYRTQLPPSYRIPHATVPLLVRGRRRMAGGRCGRACCVGRRGRTRPPSAPTTPCPRCMPARGT